MARIRFDEAEFEHLSAHSATGRGYHSVICGENLDVLTALASTHAGKVDVAYLDPPYNTGNIDWRYNNRFGAGDAWIEFMRERLLALRVLLNPERSAVIATIDEKEYLRLGILLGEVFPAARLQMVTAVTNPRGSSRSGMFARTDEYIFFVLIGTAAIQPARLGPEWSGSAHTAQRKGAHWRALVRRGEHELREDRPAMFYPVFVEPGVPRVHSIGDQIGPEDDPDVVTAPAGTVAVWPETTDGREGRWRVGADKARELLADRYLGVAKARYTKGGFYVHYLSPAEIAKIGSGEYRIIGERPNGTVDIEVTGRARAIPGTTWQVTSHDAGRYGTKLLGALIPGCRFPYPKSLYAVEDCLRFVCGADPDALVLDIFGGSGTTAHAVARLNHADGGRRGSITVTNNEVSAQDAKQLAAAGFGPGDPEWEARGIFRQVTRPRLQAAFTGRRADGTSVPGNYEYTDPHPMANGLGQTVEFAEYRCPEADEAGDVRGAA